MSESIIAQKDILDGTLEIELKFNPNGSYITFQKEFNGEVDEVLIEDATGDCVDIPKDWIILNGAALEKAQQKLAIDYGLQALSNYIIFKGSEEE